MARDLFQISTDATALLDDSAAAESIQPSEHLDIFNRLIEAVLEAGGLSFTFGNFSNSPNDKQFDFRGNNLNSVGPFGASVGKGSYDAIINMLPIGSILHYRDITGREAFFKVLSVFDNTGGNLYALTIEQAFTGNPAYDFSASQKGYLFVYESSENIDNRAIQNEYLILTNLFSGQNTQTEGRIQYVSDATADPNITTGGAYYEYLGTTNGDLTDYRLLSSQEGNDAGSSDGVLVTTLTGTFPNTKIIQILNGPVTGGGGTVSIDLGGSGGDTNAGTLP